MRLPWDAMRTASRGHMPRRPAPSRLARALLPTALLLATPPSLLAQTPPAAIAGPAADAPIRLQVVGGLDGVSQYTRLQEPFWTRRLPEVTGGRVTADIAPFDRSGIRGPEALRLLRLGVTLFGTALLPVVAAEEPELSSVDLPGIAPDMETLRRIVAAKRSWLENTLRDRHETELLGIYVYPAQVLFCNRPLSGMMDLRGRRVRTPSAAVSEWVAGLGAVPVLTTFAETVPSVRMGIVECAITGTLSGWQIGLNEVTTHVHAMALGWGVSIFGANRAAWAALPPAVREMLRSELSALEARIWDAADTETGLGLACNTGHPNCPAELMASSSGRRARGRMTLVPVTPEDDATRRRLVKDVIMPRWADRCGPGCAETWNAQVGTALGIAAPQER
ncbi:TRAP transporter substrate-binding protein [Roseomonas sp. KE2513]|uniref:TRAP transporter substrate-binding protein n=1 Tax=Roseomonas sp. KE2513 TaxID=2479202 RepID=UPI0018DF20B7|nr:TRAP transporter substrate-binding protein [Roseomonas sp. KE2513]